jgi:hypothetical protein
MEKGACLAQGRTAEIFAWGERDVLKLFREGWTVEDRAYEAAMAEAIYAAGAPSPAIRDVVEVDGRLGIVYERIDGPSLESLVTCRPWLIARAACILAETQVATQSHSVPDLPPLRQVLEKRIRAASPLSLSLRAAALRALESLPDGNALCHGDLHVGNVLLSPHEPVVIDWENATHGHPLTDVARTLLLMRMGSVYSKSAFQRGILRGIIALLLALYVRRYRQLRPFMPEEIAAWQLPVTAARLCEGVTPEEPRLLALVAKLAMKSQP